MVTDIEICNMALDHLGVTKKITKFTDGTKESSACARWYAHTRDLVLRALPWPFATCFIALEPTGGSNPMYAYEYSLPDNYAKSRVLWLAGRRLPVPPIPFDVVLNADGDENVLVTDAADVTLEYTARISEKLFTPQFVDVLALRLASVLVQPLALEAGLAKSMIDQYRSGLLDAYSAESNGRTFDPYPEAEAITVRG